MGCSIRMLEGGDGKGSEGRSSEILKRSKMTLLKKALFEQKKKKFRRKKKKKKKAWNSFNKGGTKRGNSRGYEWGGIRISSGFLLKKGVYRSEEKEERK